MNQRINLKISGFVQGIGYRAWAVKQAQGLELTGWVKNCYDGSVEIVAEGNQNNLDELVRKCRKGPEGAEVGGIIIHKENPTGEFDGFKVVY